MSLPYLDISRRLDASLPTWPDSPGFATSWLSTIPSGADANVTRLELDVHTGTHVDAPLHFVDGGANLEDIGLAPFVGPAFVADVPDVARIDAETLGALGLPDGTTRLLLRTRNSTEERYRGGPFDQDYAALTLDAAQWVVDHGLVLVGIDYASVQRFEDSPETHRVILGAGVAILEGLDLREAAPGPHLLVCLPIRLTGAEGAPARAILLPA